ncbi:MAG TPA: FkbM family methyltransferase [Rhodocyclaceae bacterium]
MSLLLTAPGEAERIRRAQAFCAEFLGPSPRPRYVFGRNVYGAALLEAAPIAGFVDDYTSEREFLGKPVVKSSDLPKDAMVIAASGGRPLSVQRQLDGLGLEHLDYFAFLKWSGRPLTPVVFNEGFAEDYAAHEAEYQWIHDTLADEESRQCFRKLVSFRIKYDLALLEGFTAREDRQYFEPFLGLKKSGETFVDIGGFDGYTSLQFIEQCPDYAAIHLFEPEPDNYQRCVERLQAHPRAHCRQMGLSNAKGELRMAPQGSASKLSNEGSVTVQVDTLAAVVSDPVSLIKIDIEGAEYPALQGAEAIIQRDHPRLALAIYHTAGDFWRIPRLVLAMRPDYRIYLRHYTESIYETVMSFVPG